MPRGAGMLWTWSTPSVSVRCSGRKLPPASTPDPGAPHGRGMGVDCRGWVHMDDSLSLHRKRRPNRVLATLALTATAALIAAACSGGSESTTGERPDLPVAESSSESPLPQVTVWDVGDPSGFSSPT
ncbi:MAG: hypothetical protein R2789_19270 [Microthrixaceae bacterium]